MKVITYAKFTWNGKEYVQKEEDSYEYTGPVALCTGEDSTGMGNGPDDNGGFDALSQEDADIGAAMSAMAEAVAGMMGGDIDDPNPFGFSRVPAKGKNIGSILDAYETKQTNDIMNWVGRALKGLTLVNPSFAVPAAGWGLFNKSIQLADWLGPKLPAPTVTWGEDATNPAEGNKMVGTQEMLASILKGKGQIDINEFINSLLKRS